MPREPELRCYMNLMALRSFPETPMARNASFQQQLETLRSAGYTGVQFDGFASPAEVAACRATEMGFATSNRVNAPDEADALAERVAGDGYESCTLHVGWGLEDDCEAHKLIESILRASSRWHIPLYIETHRATICQDMWRTVQFVRHFPDMRFNADFSHWYAGQEMVYGGFDRKLAFIQPVLDRVRFVHGRIANPGCIQVAVPEVDESASAAPEYVDHFRRLWTAAFRGFQHAAPEGHICFTPELLAPEIYYARTFNGVEESNRWEQSLLLNNIARQCFACAQLS